MKKEQSDAIEKRLIELPKLLINILKKNTSEIQAQEAFFLFVGYAELIYIYQKYVFSKQEFVHGNAIEPYRWIVKQFKSKNFLGKLTEKAIAFIEHYQQNQSFSLIDILYYMKKTDMCEEKINLENFEAYIAVFNAINELCQNIYKQSKRKNPNWEKKINLPSIHPNDAAQTRKIFTIVIRNLIENNNLIKTYWSKFSNEQQYNIGIMLYEDYYLEDYGQDFIRTTPLFSQAMVNAIHSSKKPALTLYLEEKQHDDYILFAFICEKLNKRVKKELDIKLLNSTPQELRHYFLERNNSDSLFIERILQSPIHFRRLFDKIKTISITEEFRIVCQNKSFIKAVMKKPSPINTWFLTVKTPFNIAVDSFKELQEALTPKIDTLQSSSRETTNGFYSKIGYFLTHNPFSNHSGQENQNPVNSEIL